ncbi:MAG: hypothetical protein LBL21_02855 [Rickettsiales bacterium]|jgi:hypothetical protein|nr:hypothetical protein [Rickettsiales bacterium]
MNSRKIIACLAAVPALLVSFGANAYEYKYGRNTFRLTGSASTENFDGGGFADYLIRAQASRLVSDGWNVGFVYSYDALARRGGYYAKDAFAYVETKWGRIEAGWTESIAAKLALVLPDVGGTRLNNQPFFLKDGFEGITSPTVRGNQYAWRMNAASLPTRPWQFGIGRTVYADDFDGSTDIGIRYRHPQGRIKTSLSFGFSYIDRPHGMTGDAYLPPVFATAQYQGTTGFNLQWGSLVWAATGKVVVNDNPEPDSFKSDGLQAGTGLSYDFLSWSASAGYIFSYIGVWRGGENIAAHTGILSARYKIRRYFNIWGSGGIVALETRDPYYFLRLGAGVSF